MHSASNHFGRAPYDPHHFYHHLVHRKEAHYQGDRAPDETSFYEDVAKALLPAAQIVLIGHATGASSALDVLVAYLKKHYPNVSRCAIATEAADLSVLTEPEVEAIARRHMDSKGCCHERGRTSWHQTALHGPRSRATGATDSRAFMPKLSARI